MQLRKYFLRTIILALTLSATPKLLICNSPQQIWQWMGQIGGTGEDLSGGLVIDQGDNIYLAGGFTRQLSGDKLPIVSAGRQDMFVAAWSKSHKQKWVWTAGSKGNDRITALILLPDKQMLVGGSVSPGAKLGKQIIPDKGRYLFLAKLNDKGECTWTKEIIYSKNAALYLLETDADGNIYAAGTFTDSLKVGEKQIGALGKRDGFLLKLNTAGEVDQLMQFGSEQDEKPSALAIDTTGNVYIALNFTSSFAFQDQIISGTEEGFKNNACLLQLDNELKMQWSKVLRSPYYISVNALKTDLQNRVYMMGVFEPELSIENQQLVSVGETDIFMARFDALGSELLIKQLGSAKAEYAGSLVPTRLGGMILTGAFNDTMQIDSVQLNFEGAYSNGFVVQYSEDGKIRYADQVASMGNNFGRFASLDSEGNLYLGGEFRNSLESVTNTLASAGQTDVFVAKFHNCETEEDAINGQGPLCPGSELILSTNIPYSTICWNDTIKGQRRLVVDQPGLHHLRLIDDKGCRVTDTIEIELAQEPLPFLGEDTIVDIAGTIILDPAGNYVDYLWQDNSVEESYRAAAPDGQTGKCTYHVFVTDTLGCTGADTIEVTWVDKTPWMSLEGSSLSTFPNPVESWLNWSVESGESGKLQIELTDVTGNRVYQEIIGEYIPGQVLQIDMRRFKPGIYYLSVSNRITKLTEPVIYE